MARRPLERERVYLDGGRRTAQLMRDSLGGTGMTSPVMRTGRTAHILFHVSIIGKGLDGVLETLGGVLLFLVSPAQIHSLVRALTQHELSEDPHDLVATYLRNSADHLSGGSQTFAATYLLLHGIVKMALVAALLLKRRPAYPAAIVAFFLFLVYQLYRYSHTHAPELLALSILDLLIICLTWLEYRRLKTGHGFASGRLQHDLSDDESAA